ncbi:MAG: bifunctional methylenetetrahydrofolate dehydrogenase/methenyltetrahydrofolate cyclohydrolase FolD [Candidatus Kariarchaeaceae archaeon]|jgi:methylenetetrahydrofolate dehydrogenase (NADP+)/methenyltetrahydrofolate cyclohydrolase
MELIDGKAVAASIREELKEEIAAMETKPKLVVVLVGDDAASKVYVGMKERDATEIGMEGSVIRKPANTSQEELERIITQLNRDETVHGILLQLPIPDHLDEARALDLINPDKDVDGLHDVNVGRLHNKKDGLRPCTPSGVMELLRRYDVDTSGKRAVVIGRSNLVGKPVARMLEQANATVTLCHSRTKDLDQVCRGAEILVVAAGRPNMVTADMVSDGAVVIDVGINRVDGKLVGDVDFEQVKLKASKITPVPGGVGPMTRAVLLQNCLKAMRIQNR